MNESRPRGPGVIYGGVTLALLALVSIVALTQRQSPPPTIAEFAPQAVENITDSPAEQSSGSGPDGGGKATAPTPASDAGASPPAVDVPRVRRCTGDPPRQIEDPQSPPCVPYWVGDNGGATAKGVTRDEVRIAYPVNQGQPLYTFAPYMEAFFNKRFEFYGRRLKIVPTPLHFDCGPTAQNADAVYADEEARVFASATYMGCSGYYYGRELARRGIVSGSREPSTTEAELAALRPYMWQYPMAVDRQFAAMGTWMCSRLAGRPAIHGDPVRAGTVRKFGIVFTREPDSRASPAPVYSALAACGQARPQTVEFPMNGAGVDQYSNAMLRMKSDGVTTILALCNYGEWMYMSRGATSQGYFPEWLLSTYFDNDNNGLLSFYGAGEHLAHSFGVTFQPRQQAPSNEPSFWAEKEVNPDFGNSYQQSSLQRFYRNAAYRSLLLLASGIQLAGPRLNATTFEQGLLRTVFPNPQTPIRAGRVGFAGDHTMTEDAAEWWWSGSARSPYSDQSGTICYVDGGERRMLGQWPSGDPFFSGPCDSGAV